MVVTIAVSFFICNFVRYCWTTERSPPARPSDCQRGGNISSSQPRRTCFAGLLCPFLTLDLRFFPLKLYQIIFKYHISNIIPLFDMYRYQISHIFDVISLIDYNSTFLFWSHFQRPPSVGWIGYGPRGAGAQPTGREKCCEIGEWSASGLFSMYVYTFYECIYVCMYIYICIYVYIYI